MSKFFLAIKKHKIASAIAIIILIGGGYYWYSRTAGGGVQTRYVTAAVTRETLTTFVSGNGQVSASSQVDLKPKVSGNYIKVAVSASQTVKRGDIIAQIDATNAYKTVRDAQSSLASARLALAKLKQAADANSTEQARNSVTAAQTSLDKLKLSQPIDLQNARDDLETAQNNLTKAYSDAFTAISNSFLSSPNIISALNDILTSDQISSSEISLGKGQLNTDALYNSAYYTDQLKIKSYEIIAANDYAAARRVYDSSYSDFKNASVYSDTAAVENLLAVTLATAKAAAQAIKSENNYLAAWSDARTLRNSSIFTHVAAYKTNLSAYSGQTNNSITNLSSAQAAIQSGKEAITAADNQIKTLAQNQPLDLAAAQNAVKEKQSSLAALMAGADPLDIQTQQLNIQQKQNALYDAQSTLADYTIRAPFDGIVAVVNVKVGDAASSGAAAAIIITRQQLVEISLNEVDAAKIKVGQKVSLTFDAIDGLGITGKAAQIDSLGTVSQGVVNYNVKIVLDTQDARIKPGMSANAGIITNVKIDVLAAPNSAVKTDGSGASYIQMLDANGQPQNKTVQIGIANDTSTEIVSGLSEGDNVVTQTISASGATGAAAPQIGGGFGGLRIPGLGGGGGNFRRTGN